MINFQRLKVITLMRDSDFDVLENVKAITLQATPC